MISTINVSNKINSVNVIIITSPQQGGNRLPLWSLSALYFITQMFDFQSLLLVPTEILDFESIISTFTYSPFVTKNDVTFPCSIKNSIPNRQTLDEYFLLW